MLCICFTGHRPNKLGGYNWNSLNNQKIMKKLKSEIITLIKIANQNGEKEFSFICGGALGIDQMAFDIVYKIKQNVLKSDIININIYLYLAMPFKKQSDNWYCIDDKNRLVYQMNKSDKVIMVDELENYKYNKIAIGEYHPAKMQLRNQYMVDNSHIIIGIWDGTSGGTANCINYARKLNKQIIIINPKSIL